MGIHRRSNNNLLGLGYRKYLLGTEESNFKKAASIGLGICMGIMPVWGWQMALAMTLAYFLKLNKVLTVVASNISIPPMIPFILYGSYTLGGMILASPDAVQRKVHYTLEFVRQNLVQYLVGSVVLAVGMGLLTGLITFGLLSLFRRKRHASHAGNTE